MKEAAFYQPRKNNTVQCLLCPHYCVISPGKNGICQGRINIDGSLYSDTYAKISSLAVDPVEKKPLYHFYPGEKVLSVGTYGCNFRCQYCQNWEISQQKPSLTTVSPEELVELACQKNTIGIAFTYSEPSIWYEYILETASLAQERDLRVVLVTNGYINEKPLHTLLPVLDGINVDLKSFRTNFYKDICGGTLNPVLENIKLMAARVHLEITTLVISGENDSQKEVEKMFSWLSTIDSDIPVHLTRYFPAYKFKKAPTSLDKMVEVYQIARKYMDYVYLGNIQGDFGKITRCPVCGRELLVRDYYTSRKLMKGNKCPQCGKEIYGEFK
ncbi:AmmeMemoRadiSam system radical SAM enzyme [Halocella sp. SP3-1]|uniref:AmmeMemoRadiSam system radical SAM enzyme n=1 Tax=Halocella sp. SP3-1 TaxID=2382161 RepID=UPI000F7635F4|nr:AmmeMemoRadiSam system radical SAM enzyme [Halocella sp. SP3-1]AZO96508.1 AmmeMemoRadiSam system radical SAM enzyme [Halocella sp. SP3-1]